MLSTRPRRQLVACRTLIDSFYIDDLYFYVFYLVFIYNSFFGIRPFLHIHLAFCPGPYGGEVEFFFFFFFNNNVYF